MENINAIDLVIIAIFTMSALIGIFRGLFRETISLFTWVLAIVLGVVHGAKLGSLLVFIPSQAVQKTVGVTTIIILVVVFGMIARMMAFKSFGIGKPIGIDRFLGGIFGIFRAWVVVALALAFVASTSAKDQDEYKDSKVVPYFNWAVDLFGDAMHDKLNKAKEKAADKKKSSTTPDTPTATTTTAPPQAPDVTQEIQQLQQLQQSVQQPAQQPDISSPANTDQINKN